MAGSPIRSFRKGLFEIKLEPQLGSGRYVMVRRRGSQMSEVAKKFLASTCETTKLIN